MKRKIRLWRQTLYKNSRKNRAIVIPRVTDTQGKRPRAPTIRESHRAHFLGVVTSAVSHLAAVDSNRIVRLLIPTCGVAFLRIPSIVIRFARKRERIRITRRIGHWHRSRSRQRSRWYVYTYPSFARDVTLMAGQFAEACRVKVRLPCKVLPRPDSKVMA